MGYGKRDDSALIYKKRIFTKIMGLSRAGQEKRSFLRSEIVCFMLQREV